MSQIEGLYHIFIWLYKYNILNVKIKKMEKSCYFMSNNRLQLRKLSENNMTIKATWQIPSTDEGHNTGLKPLEET